MIRVQAAPFDAAALVAELTAGRTDVGAVVTFTGLVRADDGLLSLTLEHFPGMTETELARIDAEAQIRWQLAGSLIVHRYGRLVPGEAIVLVVTASAHRRDAFEAAEFLMDWLKTHAPFWKREERADGSTAWVEAKATDDAAAARWR